MSRASPVMRWWIPFPPPPPRPAAGRGKAGRGTVLLIIVEGIHSGTKELLQFGNDLLFQEILLRYNTEDRDLLRGVIKNLAVAVGFL